MVVSAEWYFICIATPHATIDSILALPLAHHAVSTRLYTVL